MEGEDARLYTAVKALSDFCCGLQINVPTGKDSLSMTQKYPDGSKVVSPGTVIVSAGAEVSDIKKVVSPVLVNDPKSYLYHIDFSFDALKLGGSAFAQSLNKVGDDVPWNLEGFYDKWSKPTYDNVIRYTNISPGNYILRVRSISEDNLHIIDEKSIEIVIHPPFWGTIWAKLLYIVIFGLIVWDFMQHYNTYKEQKASTDKIRFFINTAHAFISGRNSLRNSHSYPFTQRKNNERATRNGPETRV